ncbi:MAG: GerMN domain-containing protein [Treponema sp.]|nr:GerMN domain-containing protein [Treponema sp.]
MAYSDNDMRHDNHRDNRQKKYSSTNGSGLGLALWVAAALILFILFVVNQGKIIANLKATGFFSRVFGKTPTFIENADVPYTPSEKNDVDPLSSGTLSLATTPYAAPEHTDSEPIQPLSQESNAKDSDGASTVSGQTMSIKLFFMAINSDGSVTRKEVSRQMKKTSSPLVDSINALIAGPSVEEEDDGCRTLVSNGTQLIGASVSNSIATLNFSSEFEFNQFGIEGTRGQLQQIVYTATAFPTVESVQFLIDGEKRDYLGSEGVWIGTPLSRDNFLSF